MMVFGLGAVSVQAADIGLRWVNVDMINLNLSFSDGAANAKATITGKAGTEKISATFLLKEKNGNKWTTVHTWATKSVNGKSLSFTGSADAESGKDYRLYVTVSVKNSDGGYETATDYLEKTY